jgi:uncharacterized membrane protein YhaH (DUF805 family)
VNYYFEVLGKYADFSGRARRAEYWMFTLVNVIISVVIAVAEEVAGSGGIVGLIYGLAVLLPGFAVTARRLHDTDRSGWWMLISLIPILGWIVFLVFMCTDGSPGTNRYGPNPKDAVDPMAFRGLA